MSVRFCPKYPNHLLQFYSTEETLRNNEGEFYAIDLNEPVQETRSPYQEIPLERGGKGRTAALRRLEYHPKTMPCRMASLEAAPAS